MITKDFMALLPSLLPFPKLCLNNTLIESLVKGNIDLCEGIGGEDEALRAGAIGVLMLVPTLPDHVESYPLPACFIRKKDASKIFKYISSTRNPVAIIFKTYVLNDTSAPVVASFSSRGPNTVMSDILKPDLSAPGVDILASWPSNSPISENPKETRKLEFNILSGTSMACPHVSGAAAYLKSFHPTWSPAAIRSALMTTAKKMSPTKNKDAEFGYGAGEVDPVKALHPGLIYDANVDDYIKLLCGYGLTTTTLRTLTEDDSNCSKITPISARDLNYPSFALKVSHPRQHISGRFRRTVTNVGTPVSTYRAVVTVPKGLHIYVIPRVLSFTSLGENHTYVVIVDGVLKKPIESASITWDDGYFKVRSPIVVFDDRAEKVATSLNSDRKFVIITVVVIFCINFIIFAISFIRFMGWCTFL
ncbi:cucumisin-like [Vicia villosa]|uniref:cucumisin-like n=1 Tax=Vicia villosa TaxID=3911 RepID=UPI00273C380E|nr:cucumisin-like [Vicia villosa]